jgi:hypothetical protein
LFLCFLQLACVRLFRHRDSFQSGVTIRRKYGTALVAYRTTKVPLANEERNQLSYMSDICSEQAWKALPPETARDAQNVTPFMRGCLDVFISQVKTTGLLKDVSLKEVPINADPHQLLPESAK